MAKKKKVAENISADKTGLNVNNAITDGSFGNKQSASTKRFKYLKTHPWAIAVIVLVSLGAFGAGLKYLEEDAARIKAERSSATNLKPANEGLLSKINPFLPAPMPSPTPQLSKEYIYAGGKLLAVEDANATAVPPADLAVWRPSTGTWWVLGGTGSQQMSQQWGASGDTAAPGDYDGDGKTDFAVYRGSNGTWYVMKSSNGAGEYYFFGASTDVPVPADYDGDGKTDAALFRPSTGYWYLQLSSTGQLTSVQFGLSGDVPTPNDYDGDGKADVAVWRSSGTATFYVYRSSDLSVQSQAYGLAGDKPATADYDGDGKADFSVRRGNNWYAMKSSDGQTFSVLNWGFSSDKEVPNDYDGDGKADIAIWRAVESSPGAGDVGVWAILNSSDGSSRVEQWGLSGDIPVPAFYRR